MLLFKHKSYHKLQIYAYMISWLRVLELENTKGLMNLRKRLGMSFKCWLRQWPFQGKVSPALESSPTLGEGRRQRGLYSAPVSAGPEVWWWQGSASIPAPCADPSLCWSIPSPHFQPSATQLLLPAKEGSGGLPKQIGEFNSTPHSSQINRLIYTLNKPVCQVQSFKSIRTKGLINVCSKASGTGGGFDHHGRERDLLCAGIWL